MMEFLSRDVADDGQQNVRSRRYDSWLKLSRVFLGYFFMYFGWNVKAEMSNFLSMLRLISKNIMHIKRKVYASVYVSPYVLYIHMYVFMFLSIYLLSIYLSIYLSIFLSIYLSYILYTHIYFIQKRAINSKPFNNKIYLIH